jgi:ankyrin repeat protein
MMAICKGNIAIFELLLGQPQTDLTVRDTADKNAIELALFNQQNLVFAENLVKKGADLNATDTNGMDNKIIFEVMLLFLA